MLPRCARHRTQVLETNADTPYVEHSPEPIPKREPTVVRLAVFALCAAAITATWLQPLYEAVVEHGAVFVPRWWDTLTLVCPTVLLLIWFPIMVRYRKLNTVCWISLLACLLSILRPATF